MHIVIDYDFVERIVTKIVEAEETPPCERKGIDRFSCFYEDECGGSEDCNCVNGIILDNYYETFIDKKERK